MFFLHAIAAGRFLLQDRHPKAPVLQSGQVLELELGPQTEMLEDCLAKIRDEHPQRTMEIPVYD